MHDIFIGKTQEFLRILAIQKKKCSDIYIIKLEKLQFFVIFFSSSY